jgi:hypothetical protein
MGSNNKTTINDPRAIKYRIYFRARLFTIMNSPKIRVPEFKLHIIKITLDLRIRFIYTTKSLDNYLDPYIFGDAMGCSAYITLFSIRICIDKNNLKFYEMWMDNLI